MSQEIYRRRRKTSSLDIVADGVRPLTSSQQSNQTSAVPPAPAKIIRGRPSLGKFNVRMAATAGGGATSNVSESGNFPFYSPQLSNDYFKLPRSNQERREWYRHFYENDELVARAIDLHCDLPLSKVTLAMPKCEDKEKAEYIWRYFKRMIDRIRLFERLQEISFEYNLHGNVFIFAEEDEDGLNEDYETYAHMKAKKIEQEEQIEEEDEDDTLSDYLTDEKNQIDEELGDSLTEVEKKVEEFIDNTVEKEELPKEQAKAKEQVFNRYKKWNFKNIKYRGWQRLIVLPPDQVLLETYDFSDEVRISLIPSDSMKKILENRQIDERTQRILDDVPQEIISNLTSSEPIPLDTDPYMGSHCYHLARRKSQYEDFGISILQRCLRTLAFRDQLRQSQTLIADRALTPKHLIWGENLSDFQVDDLREQVDLALVDPDYAIITNFQVNWDQISGKDRLLDLSAEYAEAENRLLMGLGVTKELLTGEGSYGGSRISLEIMNTQYLLFREKLQHWVEEFLFKPVAIKKGFIEVDPIDGEVIPVYPQLKFTRLAVRDNAELYEQLFALYQKGSLPVEYILELWNIDSDEAKQKLEKDLFTVNDSKFNDLLGGVYQAVPDKLIETSNIVGIIRDNLNLEEVKTAPTEGGGRFSSTLKKTANQEVMKETLKNFKDFKKSAEYKEFLDYLEYKKKKETKA